MSKEKPSLTFKKFLSTFGLKQKLLATSVMVMMTIVIYGYQSHGFSLLFNANILQSPAPFDGTVFPVEKIPNWTKWKGDNQVDAYSTIPSNMLIDLPNYNPTELQLPNESLVWGNKEDDAIRNAKLTYSVVYLGNYELDHKEGAGSHLAVDIRMPIGTPVQSIANGKVITVSMIENGFGHHVVIEHPNVPDPEHPGQKTTLYSAYNHMSDISVKEGQIVSKGQIIGKSGKTGTATTPHLHFQIDTASAPWHPYWPFTWAESEAAGLDFFEAVNAGLGLAVAKQYTTNPLMYVQKYLDNSLKPDAQEDQNLGEANNSAQPSSELQIGEGLSEEEVAQIEVPIKENYPVVDGGIKEIDPSLLSVSLSGEKFSLLNQGVGVTAKLDSITLAKMSDEDVIKIETSGVGQSLKDGLKKSDFIDGVARFNVMSSEVGTSNISVGKSVYQLYFIDKVMPLVSVGIETEEEFRANQTSIIKIVTLDENGNRTPSDNFPGVMEISAKEGQAEFIPSTLTKDDFVDGEASVQMNILSNEPLVIQAHEGAIVGESKRLSISKSDFFTDVAPSDSHYKAIKSLTEEGVISGYPDGTFQPKKVVNRVEALKMLMLAFEVKVENNSELPFIDTDEKAWYANTLATAFQKAIVEGYSDGTFKPAQVVDKAEYLKMLFETNEVKPKENLEANPYIDVPANTWYAGYAYLANKQNLIDVTNNELNAADGMTRGDVAETIYRMKYLLENNLISYIK